jgi:magnesium chelatase family protein
MDVPMLRRHLKLDSQGEQMMARASERGLLSARGQHRAMRVARTLADLKGRERVGAKQISEALMLRPETGVSERRAA